MTAAIPAPAGEMDLDLELVEGLHCAACVDRAEGVLKAIPGVSAPVVNLATRAVHLRFAPDRTTVAAIKTRLSDAGFTPQEATEGNHAPSAGQGARAAQAGRHALIAALIALPLMAIGMLHLGHHPALPWLSAGLATAALAGPGRGIVLGGLHSLLRGRGDMDALIAIGALSGWLFSCAVLIRPAWWAGTPPLTFEASASIIAVVLLGRYLEARARAGASSALERLLVRRGASATLIEHDGERQVPLSVVAVGDLLRVRPGELVPVDGVVISGQASVDEAILTGESRLIEKMAGAPVLGGSLNQAGSVEMRASAIGADTVVARLVALVRQAQGTRPPIARTADRAAGVFVPVVLALSALTAGLWLLIAGDPARAIQAAAGVLLISCPCALGLATPMAVMVAVGRAAELGVLVRSGAVLEAASRVTVLVFDKTGTLTTGRPAMVASVSTPPTTAGELLRVVAAAERGSEHPIAGCLRAAAGGPGPGQAVVSGFRSHPGGGVTAQVDGQALAVGSAAFLAGLGLGGAALAPLALALPAAATPVFAVRDGQAIGAIAVADVVRDDAATTVAELRGGGLEIAMLTGDRLVTAQAIASRLDIATVHADCLPGDKLARIRALQAAGAVVAMVGDGINDAPALGQADVGIAMGTGTDAAAGAGDLVLLGDRLSAIPAALALARATMRTIKRNLLGASLYNLLALPLAAGALYPWTGQLLDPMLAAGAMALSSLTVVASSLRLRTFHA
jgi:Cu+-exporting ATPase